MGPKFQFIPLCVKVLGISDLVLRNLLYIHHCVQDAIVEFVYLATSEDNPLVKAKTKLSNPGNHEVNCSCDETCSWFAYSAISVANQGKYSADTKEILQKLEQDNG